jgi:hypothetical protein
MFFFSFPFPAPETDQTVFFILLTSYLSQLLPGQTLHGVSGIPQKHNSTHWYELRTKIHLLFQILYHFMPGVFNALGAASQANIKKSVICEVLFPLTWSCFTWKHAYPLFGGCYQCQVYSQRSRWINAQGRIPGDSRWFRLHWVEGLQLEAMMLQSLYQMLAKCCL